MKTRLFIILFLIYSLPLWGLSTITLTDFTDYRVFQRTFEATTGYCTIAGTYTGTATPIEARIVQHGTSTEVVTWTQIVASPTGGTFAGLLSNIPQGGWYNVQVRDSNNHAVISNGTHRWGIGMLIGIMASQSNGARYTIADGNGGGTDYTANSLLAYNGGPYLWLFMGGGADYRGNGWTHPTTWANAGIKLADAIISAYNIPVGIINFSVDSMGISTWLTGQDNYTQFITRCNSSEVKDASDAKGRIEYIISILGEMDAILGTSQATYDAGLDEIYANLSSDISFKKMLISTLGNTVVPYWTTEHGNWIRAAQASAIANNANMMLGATGTNNALGVDPHWSNAGYVTSATEMAAAIVDSVPPTVTILTSDPQATNQNSISISWTDDDDVGVTSRKWRIDSAPDGSNGTVCTSPATVTPLIGGSHLIYIGAGDAAGNWGSDSITVNYTPINLSDGKLTGGKTQ